MDEFRLIERIARVVRRGMPHDPRVVVGIGDDAAVLAPAGRRVVATTDTLVDGVHFRLDLCSPRDAGRRAAAANLSDLAAMGARPLAVLVGLQVPRSGADRDAIDAMKGLADACRRHRVHVAGGNVCVAPGPLAIAVTALGEAPHRGCLLRSGARPGDVVAVSGPLGSASLGLAMLASSPSRRVAYGPLASAYLRPKPRLDLGAALAATPGVHAAIDVSDGLLQDLGHVLDASGVGAEVEVSRVPIATAALRFAAEAGLDATQAALTGGDDYELVATAAPSASRRLKALGMVAIGVITRRRGLVLTREGRRIALPRRLGYRHL
jgi:thiamine-monophosphate kinase